ncbi:7TM-DISM domain-containing protein [Thalassolituus sp. LLYu03]|uniref:7TM-DISM domain-containing protein n=1 Tax=Thalassolituus sp. LLYu03 TaxID=3421656 RepID=UPI003D2B29DA
MMKYRGFWCVLVSWLLISFPVQANNPVLLPNASFDYSITPYVAVLEDPTGQLDITTMLTREQQLRFTPSHARSLKFGMTDSAYWLRFSLTNPYARERQVVVTLSGNDLDDIEFYDISAGDNYEHIRADDVARSLRGSFLQAHPIELRIPQQSTRSFLIRVHSAGLFSTQVRLMSMDRFVANEQEVFTLQGLGIGWVLATLAWFGFIFRRRHHGFALMSAGYCLSVSLYQPTWMGLYPLVFNLPALEVSALGEIALAASTTFQMLATLMLGWHGQSTRTVRYGLMALATLPVPVALAGLWLLPHAALLVVALMITAAQFAGTALLISGRSSYPRARRWLILGQLITGFGVLVAILTTYNLLSMDLFTDWAPMLLPFVVIASLVLAQMDIIRPQQGMEQRTSSGRSLSPAVLSQISHELRTPINGVIGMNELLSDTPLSAAQRDFSETIALAGRDLLHVANEISDLARIQNRTLELELRPFRLSALLNDVMAHFQQEAIRKQVELVIDIAESLPEQYHGDINRLQTLLHNLIDHSLAYTEYGEMTLQAGSYRTEAASGVRLQLQLSNTMVKQDELKQAFNILQYRQPLPEHPDREAWNLMVTRHLMEKMNATLAVESMTGHGASLTLCLPLSAAEGTPAERVDESLIGLRILIVDDNASLRTVLEKQVRRWGMRPDSTYSGKEALAMLRNQITLGQPYDVIIIDHDMPVMNGLQLAERIQQDKDIVQKPARLMLTGLNIGAVRDDALAAGIQQLLAKPASGERLRQALQELRYRRPKTTESV